MSEPITFIGATLKGIFSLIPDAIGSAVALKLNTVPMRPLERIFSFGCGVALAHYIGGAAAEWFDLQEILQDASKVIVGVFGLNLAASINKQIPSIVKGLIARFVGDGI